MADFVKKVRKSNFSPEEVHALVSSVRRHFKVLSGGLAKKQSNKELRLKLWLDVLRQVNRVGPEKRTLQEVKNKWKKIQYSVRVPKQSNDGNCRMRPKISGKLKMYDPDFKRTVVLYAEQKGNREAVRRFEISESNIKRWRRLKNKHSEQPIRRSLRKSNVQYKEYDEFEESNKIDKNVQQKPTQPQPNVLQSQPLSPTKLKVTRQSSKPNTGKPSVEVGEEVCLRWNSHHSNMKASFPSLLLKEQYVDVTLVAEGKTLKCHRLILSSCSPYFEEVLSGISPFQHPVLFLKDVPFWILKSLCDFMYSGEVHIYQNKLQDLLNVAETLKIKGLARKNAEEQPKGVEVPKRVGNVEEEKKGEVKPKLRRIEAKNMGGNSCGGMDAMNLLEPVYEEVENRGMGRLRMRAKEVNLQQIKKTITKKIKKRKYSETHEDSPPLVFQSRKGTRSRPNVKVPKYFDSYESSSKTSDDSSAIEREPKPELIHPPFIPIEDIKAEPLDLEDDPIDIENNLIGFSEEFNQIRPEEVIPKEIEFKKITLTKQPIIMEVHSITENEKNYTENKPDEEMFDPLSLETDQQKDVVQKIKITNIETIIAESNDNSEEAEDKCNEIKEIEGSTEKPDLVNNDEENVENEAGSGFNTEDSIETNKKVNCSEIEEKTTMDQDKDENGPTCEGASDPGEAPQNTKID